MVVEAIGVKVCRSMSESFYQSHDFSAAFYQFIDCLRQRRFYDAHEALEDIWFPYRHVKEAELYFIKGLINASVSFELIKRGRKEASRRVFGNYLKYKPLIAHFDSPHHILYRQVMAEIEHTNRAII